MRSIRYWAWYLRLHDLVSFFLFFQQASFRYSTFFSNHDISSSAYGSYNDTTLQVAASRNQKLVNWDFEYVLLKFFLKQFIYTYIYLQFCLSVFVARKIHWAQQQIDRNNCMMIQSRDTQVLLYHYNMKFTVCPLFFWGDGFDHLLIMFFFFLYRQQRVSLFSTL